MSGVNIDLLEAANGSVPGYASVWEDLSSTESLDHMFVEINSNLNKRFPDHPKPILVTRENILSVLKEWYSYGQPEEPEYIKYHVINYCINYVSDEIDTERINSTFDPDIMYYDGSYGIERSDPSIVKLVDNRYNSNSLNFTVRDSFGETDELKEEDLYTLDAEKETIKFKFAESVSR